MPRSVSSSNTDNTSLSRQQEVQHYREQFEQYWHHEPDACLPKFEGVQKLPDLSVGQIRRVAAGFSRSTSAVNGLHPRHLLLLPDSATELLIHIFHAGESLGTFSSTCFQVFIALLPKLDGGKRPIGLYQTLFRVWVAARRPLISQWENNVVGREAFAASKGQAPTDVVWRQSFRAETAQQARRIFGAVLWDLHKCYELISHRYLAEAAIKHQYPLGVLRITIASYRYPRVICMNQIASKPVVPHRGIIAGCATATAELRLILIDLVRKHQNFYPRVCLSVYIDDIGLDCVADDTASMLAEILPAALTLAKGLDGIALPISKTKSAILSNSKSAATSLRRSLGNLGGPPMKDTRALGVDFWAGRPFKRPPNKVRLNRLRTAKLGKHRLISLGKSSRSVAAKVFVCGTLPAILYDSPVLGFSGKQLLNIRREAGRMTGLGGKKRALDLALSFVPRSDPEVIASNALVKRFASEVWAAALPPGFRRDANLALGEIAAGVQAYLAQHAVPSKAIAGPVSSVHQAL